MNIHRPLPREDLSHVLACTKPLWEQLRGKRIFVTGATGFFGAWLLESFVYANEALSLNAELVALSRNPDAFLTNMPHLANNPSVRFHQGDVRRFQFPQTDQGDVEKFSYLIHAGTTSSTPVPDDEMLWTIIMGTQRVLEFAVAARVERFLFVSSGAVYGERGIRSGCILDNSKTLARATKSVSAYAQGKCAAEILCEQYYREHQLPTTIARCFAFVGPHLPLDAHFAIGNFIEAALEKKPIVIKSDGRSQRSYLYAADLAIWLWTILFKGMPCHPYNVGSEVPITIKELAKQVHQTLEMKSEIQIGMGGKATSYVPCTARAQEELGLKEWVSLEKAIQRHFEWLH